MLQDQTTVEEVAPGLTLEWLYENRIVVFTLSSAERPTIDAYVEWNIAVMRGWPKARPYLTMQAATPDFTLTPYMSRRALLILNTFRELGLKGRNAVIIPHKRVAQILQLLIQARRGLVPNLKARAFYDRDQGLTWLKELL